MKTKTFIQNLTLCILLLVGSLGYNSIFAQIAVTTDGTPPDGSAMLDVKSNDKGFLLPRLTTAEIVAILNPANGLIVYNTDDNHFYYFEGVDNRWKEIAIGTGTINIGCGTVADSDGNTYNTVLIGSQCWMTENLSTTKYNDGTDIPLVTDDTDWTNLTTPGYCWYNNQETYGSIYGPLYNWYTVNTGNLCPTGWHVPTDDEWTTLITNLGGGNSAGGKLKETGTTHWSSPNAYATNEHDFTALPGGFRSSFNGLFSELSYKGYWYSATEYSPQPDYGAGIFRLFYHIGLADVYHSSKKAGNSVRCVKDD